MRLVTIVLLKKIILTETFERYYFYRAGNILGTIIIHILEVGPPVRKPLSLPVPKSSSSRGKALIRTRRNYAESRGATGQRSAFQRIAKR